MFYTIYQITHIPSGRIYIGKHQTKDLDDGYMGSGKHLKRAIQKYSIDQFKKEILFVFDTEQEMNNKEAELVTEDFCNRDDTYNICTGGKGGFGYINSTQLNRVGHTDTVNKKIGSTQKGKPKKWSQISILNVRGAHERGLISYDNFLGKSHSEETKQKISTSMKNRQEGIENSQYGTIWITNGIENRKIKKDDVMPDDWYRGRKIRIDP